MEGRGFGKGNELTQWEMVGPPERDREPGGVYSTENET